ncbi:hypothetical protein StoSoilB13_11400 [Arthrobacter sp. StoSoilB13]|nr:hypothetical protein StoSoilB13_11400 [Arthrobacter sp. StoSoilB13]
MPTPTVWLMEQVYIRSAGGGEATTVVRGGREWQIAEEPFRWFERVPWWESSKRMPRGQGRVDVEVLQVQVRLGSNAMSSLATWELVRDGSGGGWYLRGEERVAA